MHVVKLNLLVRDPTDLPRVLSSISGSMRNSGCLILEKPSWILALCSGDVLVRASIAPGEAGVSIGLSRSIERGLAASIAVRVEGSRGEEVFKAVSIISSVAESERIGITMQA